VRSGIAPAVLEVAAVEELLIPIRPYIRRSSFAMGDVGTPIAPLYATVTVLQSPAAPIVLLTPHRDNRLLREST